MLPGKIWVFVLFNTAYGTSQTIQSTTSHGFLLPSCNTTSPHCLPTKKKKFTLPPTHTNSTGSICIWIATTFDGSLPLMIWIWKDTMTKRFKGKILPHILPHCKIFHIKPMMLCLFQEQFIMKQRYLFGVFFSVVHPCLVSVETFPIHF